MISFEHAPCSDHHTSAVMCKALVPEMTDGPESSEPNPIQGKRALSVAVSSTSLKFTGKMFGDAIPVLSSGA